MVKKPKNAQANQLQDENVDINITLVTHRKEKDLYCEIWYTKQTFYTDQTGKSPVKSSRGHRHG